MTSTGSVEDVVDAADGWHLFGTECPKVKIVFFCQVLYTVIVVSIYNLTVGHGDSTLWTALLSSSLGGLSVTQSITEKRRWRLSFTSFYPAIILYTVIVVSIYNLSVGHGDSTLWTALLSSSLGGLSVTQSITEKRRWRLSFTSFYPVIHRWLRTRTIRWHSTLPTYHVA